MKKKSVKFRIIKGMFSIVLLVVVITLIVFTGVMMNIIDHRDIMKQENIKIANIINNKDINTDDYKEIPKSLIDATIAIEDKRFMKHYGIDYIRTIGAVFSFIKNDGKSNYGGSTITQQLVKVTTGDDKRNTTRKIREWYRAIYIDKELSKDQIIRTYLSTIYLGNNNYGVKAAAKDFFNKDVKDLTLAQSAVIAATIQSPEGTNPYKSIETRKKLLLRKDVVLNQMYKLNKISKEEYDKTINEKIIFARDVNSIDK